ncbi:MAG TPA: MFS transporter [Candidatus Paceibacterota bacterium]|nr:MFS transporter [Candidatus Paceibacterota bacterium]
MMETIAGAWQRHKNRHAKEQGGFVELFIAKRLIHGAAAALMGIFLPIFLFQETGQQFYIVGLYFALLSLLYVLFLVPGMYAANRVGFSHALILSGVAGVGQYVILYLMSADNIFNLLPLLAVFIVLFRIFHWVPYHVDFTLFTHTGERGRVVSLSFATISFMGVVGPILAGYIIDQSGYNTLFGIVLVLLIAATISYAFVPETPTHFSWEYLQTWRNLFAKKNIAVTIGEFAAGAEVVVSLIVWPIFLYTLLDGNVLEVGALSTVIVGLTIVIQLALGKYLDKEKGSSEKTLGWGSKLNAVGWVARIFVLSATHVFFVGLFHNVVRMFTRTPFQAILYDMSAEQGKYVDEFTVLREMANHSGRALSLLTIAVLSLYVPIAWTFVIAALASLAMNMVYHIAR